MSDGRGRATLFDIGDDMRQLKDYVEELGGDVSDPAVEAMIDAWLIDNQLNLENKLEGYGWLIRQEAATGAARKAEADRMAALAKTDLNLADRLRRRLAEFFKANDLKTVDTASFRFNLQGSGGKRALTLSQAAQDDPRGSLPRKYIRMVPVVDTDLLRADLEGAGAIEAGAGTRTTKQLLGLAWLEPLGKHLVIK